MNREGNGKDSMSWCGRFRTRVTKNESHDFPAVMFFFVLKFVAERQHGVNKGNRLGLGIHIRVVHRYMVCVANRRTEQLNSLLSLQRELRPVLYHPVVVFAEVKCAPVVLDASLAM